MLCSFFLFIAVQTEQCRDILIHAAQICPLQAYQLLNDILPVLIQRSHQLLQLFALRICKWQ